jgi:hypothetical protein
MRHLKCLACKTCLRSADGEADPVGDLCPVCGSLLEPVGDLGEIVGYRVIETRGSTSRRGAAGAGDVIADGVREVIARRELEHARVRLEIESCDADSVGPQVQAVSSRLQAWATITPRTPPRSHRAAARHPGFRGRRDRRTAPPDESSRFALVGKPRTDLSLLSDAG